MKNKKKIGITGNDSESTKMIGSQTMTETFVNELSPESNDYFDDNDLTESSTEDEEIIIEEEYLNPDLVPHLSYSIGEYFVNHFLCHTIVSVVDPFNKSHGNTMVNNWYNSSKKMYELYLSEKDYGGVLITISKPYRTTWFINNYKTIYKDVGEKEYYSLLKMVLVDVEFHYSTKKVYSKLINIGSNPLLMMSRSEKKFYDKLPERFMIYRGVHSETRITPKNLHRYIGNSWTVDRKISQWFSNRFDSPYKVILSMEISKSQVVSYFNVRNEKEIFVDYEKLDYSKIRIEEVK